MKYREQNTNSSFSLLKSVLCQIRVIPVILRETYSRVLALTVGLDRSSQQLLKVLICENTEYERILWNYKVYLTQKDLEIAALVSYSMLCTGFLSAFRFRGVLTLDKGAIRYVEVGPWQDECEGNRHLVKMGIPIRVASSMALLNPAMVSLSPKAGCGPMKAGFVDWPAGRGKGTLTSQRRIPKEHSSRGFIRNAH